jgi:hypothetical protein
MPIKRMLMAEQWDSFARAVLPRDASATQKREMRRAFYAGAQGILHGVISVLAADHEPTESDMQIMQDLERELSDFADMVKNGRA